MSYEKMIEWMHETTLTVVQGWIFVGAFSFVFSLLVTTGLVAATGDLFASTGSDVAKMLLLAAVIAGSVMISRSPWPLPFIDRDPKLDDE